MIYETIVCTVNQDGTPRIVPLGIRHEQGLILLAPFRPSATLDNLQRSGHAVVNFSTDVRIFAGCLTGRYHWPVRPADQIPGFVLQNTLAHSELELQHTEEDPVRPRFYCREVFSATHAPFRGFNRAQAAVLEAAILVSRLHMLSADKVDREIAYLAIAIEKTAGPEEQEAWDWLLEKIAAHRKAN